uniref:Uncharacterized protein n=1 Tax=Candidatus Kentrum sp. LFY TaxID=2126342 RepID=A0A450UPW6_9GAMM|nr:MAG: hypothetical protein BECKLFY1418B_GA0070995_106012 [Candidatus Kentron sp. LFY]
MIKNQVLSILLSTSGVLLLIIAIIFLDEKENTIIKIAASLGGTFLGVGISFFLSLKDEQQLKKLERNLLNVIDGHINSFENKIKPFRKQWHVYYGTKVPLETGREYDKYQWRHATWNLAKQHELGMLSGTMESYNERGGPEEYQLKGMLRDERIIIFAKSKEGQEPVDVTVMPFMGRQPRGVHYGVKFHETWDTGQHSVSSVIVSPTPIEDYEKIGPIKNPEKLVARWKRKFEELNEILPHMLLMVGRSGG